MIHDSKHPSELRLPPPGGVLLATVGYATALLIMAVAVGNLCYANCIPATALVASLIWLGGFGFYLSMDLAAGCRPFLINRLGRYSRDHFLRAERVSGEGRRISIGYRLCKQEWFTLQVDASAISSLNWSAGQATSLAGRDMDDWHVALWYHHPDRPRGQFPGDRPEAFVLMGPPGPKDVVDDFGQQLVAFLTRAGVNFTPGKDSCEFNTPARRKSADPAEDAQASENL